MMGENLRAGGGGGYIELKLQNVTQPVQNKSSF